MATNWRAMQVPGPKRKDAVLGNPGNVLPRYLSMGSWHASLSKGGVCRPHKGSKGSYSAMPVKMKIKG